MKPGTPESKAEARRRLELALRMLERAQNELADAQEALASVTGAGGAWEHVGDGYERMKALWHRVAKLRDAELDLDELAIAALNGRRL